MLLGTDVRAWATGPDHFDEAVEYLEKHRLYELGLELWSGAEEYPVCHYLSNSPYLKSDRSPTDCAFDVWRVPV